MAKKRRYPSIFEMLRRMFKEMERGFRPFEEEEIIEKEFRDPFREMMERFEEQPEEFEELIKEEETPTGKIQRYGPFVYGFTYSKKPGEEPEFQEFGNIKPSEEGEIEPAPRGEREPLTEVVDMEDKYEVTVEIPGVKKDEVDLSATGDSMEIKTTGERKYRKELSFEEPIDPEKIDANFKYGILYIDVEKKEKEKKEGKKIEIK